MLFRSYRGVAERDGLGALRLLGDAAEVPQVIGDGIGHRAGGVEGDVRDGDAEALGDRRRHVGGHALRLAARAAAGHQQDVAEIDADAQRDRKSKSELQSLLRTSYAGRCLKKKYIKFVIHSLIRLM